jgi:hypothetical protein
MKHYAKIILGEKTELVEINEDLVYRDRIINELSTMALEVCPFYNGIMNCKDEDRDRPIIDMPHLFVKSETDDINEVIDIKVEEFENLITPLILKHFKIKLKKKQYLYFPEGYIVTKNDLKNGIAMHYSVEVGG